MNKRLLVLGFLGLASMLVGARSAQAQSYFYGYYYPEEHRFTSWQLNTQVDDYTTITPMWNALHDGRSGYSYPNVPTNTPMPATPSPYPSRPLTQQARMARPVTQQAAIRVMVPDSRGKGRYWFGGYKTRSTGTERVYQTPALQPGAHDYQVKVAYTQAGQKMVQERTISVTPGQSLVVDFGATMSTATVARGTP